MAAGAGSAVEFAGRERVCDQHGLSGRRILENGAVGQLQRGSDGADDQEDEERARLTERGERLVGV